LRRRKSCTLYSCARSSDKDTAEGPGKFDTASDKFYCEKCSKVSEEEFIRIMKKTSLY
jgi:hypothetical protein